MLDGADFNAKLFFPRSDTTPCPPGARDLTVPVDGASLHVRLHAAPEARATVVLFHGNGEVVADYDDVAQGYAAAGASLAVADFRGYGASTGTPTLRAAMQDARPVLQAVRALVSGPIIVMGRSVGSACANELYAQRPAEAAGFVLESGFSDLDALVVRRGLVPQLSAELREAFDPLPKLARGTHPLLVLHGTQDSIIRPAEAQAAFDRSPTRCKLITWLEGLGHNDVSTSPVYWQSLAQFVGLVQQVGAGHSTHSAVQ